MAIICPTVLAKNPHNYRTQIERVSNLSNRVQIDLSDGVFSPEKTVGVSQIWWPEGIFADVHLMYKMPIYEIDKLIRLKPSLVIVHAEAHGNFIEFSEKLHSENIRVGVAVLPETPISTLKPAAINIDHVLIFAGHLGYFGGEADLAQTKKVTDIKQLNANIEIGWDGGINDKNVALIVKAGVDVLNVGSYIQHAANPVRAYARLAALVEEIN